MVITLHIRFNHFTQRLWIICVEVMSDQRKVRLKEFAAKEFRHWIVCRQREVALVNDVKLIIVKNIA